MTKCWEETLEVERILTDARLQPRSGGELDPRHLKKVMRGVDSPELPRVHVFRVQGVGDVLVGGHYRLEAHLRKNRPTIPALVHTGTLLDAFLFSRGENREHMGLERTDGDVRHAAFQSFQLRKDAAFEWISDARIAAALHVDASWVQRLRREWEGTQTGPCSGRKPSAKAAPAAPRPGANASKLDAFVPAAVAPAPSPDLAEEEGAELAEELAEADGRRQRHKADVYQPYRDSAAQHLHGLVRDATAIGLVEEIRDAVAVIWAVLKGGAP